MLMVKGNKIGNNKVNEMININVVQNKIDKNVKMIVQFVKTYYKILQIDL